MPEKKLKDEDLPLKQASNTNFEETKNSFSTNYSNLEKKIKCF